ncbi:MULTISPECIES: U32 family peptidase [unclassified Breznakia]|uniref:peptidase U32 family protein n=1 Tax=unclassified Breznakia TaxID=2623764 RepID=UPI002473DBAB|nr:MULTISPECIES: U32 family peptidase [unclassified Breznakia]MDH6366249.1 putative protease [Breznakia sp. PH1-1]MDH6403342.1 putative protease [Breznakia sp. PF1-11]MDH6411051.1 putative protease [Breznakia sp. PFB1-11]MDH6413415.1 putative protease [Breznakia sp. PFB1-14]MDH6416180.1 putative protease [Breznakia sp. PFB1-4]
MRKVELLAPAGDLARLKIAVRYGANAVYLGGKKFSLRSRASNFDIEDIAEGVQFAHAHGAHVHVTVNMLPHEEDLEGLEAYLKDLERVGVDAIIVASFHIMKLAKQVAPNLEVHVSTQHSSTNSGVIDFYEKQGMNRVVLARECTLDDVKATMQHAKLPVEVFIHGGMCISYSGRCTMSNSMTLRDANRGGCAQSCRWKYKLYDKDVPIYKEDHLFSMSSKDLNAMRFLPELIDAGVASFKIEGRMKSPYYLATVVRSYRKLIDTYQETGQLTDADFAWVVRELAKAENRLTGPGFYAGLPKMEDHLYGVNGAGVSQEFIAYVLDYDQKTQMAKLEVRNNFKIGDEAEAFGPSLDNTNFKVDTLYDEDGEIVDVARNPMQVLYTKVDIKLQKHDMIRKVMTKREKVY